MEFFVSNQIKTTNVYDTYWRFAYERQNIFIKRVQGKNFPWTTDEILLRYKFTNTYRANDRVSQYLIKNIIYSFIGDIEDVLFRILLFKIFNKIETWEYLEKTLGIINYKSFSKDKLSNALSKLYHENTTIYSNAYIMSSGINEFGHKRKYENHIDLLEYIFKNSFALKVSKCNSLEELYHLLLSYPTIGPFLAFQYAIDINYSEICDFNEMDFVVAGPGAKSGIKKCFSYISNYSEADIIRYMSDRQEYEFARLNLCFKNLYGRNLQLIDCQNLFCETDKYARVAHPNIVGLSHRTRIKQMYKKNDKRKIDFFYPPKWGINDKMASFYNK